jgi:adenylate kinase family enzyme
MKRIMVIGSGGAGKSTFSNRLGEILGIEVIHLDQEYWRAGWVEPPKDVWRRKVEELVGGGEWIIDGNYSGTLDVRLAACDTIIFLDLPRTVCLWRVLKRVAASYGETRPDMAEGCKEQFDLKFLLWIWNYASRSRPKVLAAIEKHSAGKEVFRLRSPAAVEKFLSRAAERKQTEVTESV